MIKLCFPMMEQRNLDIFHHDGGADCAKVMVKAIQSTGVLEVSRPEPSGERSQNPRS